jgi:uridylate kinase
MTVSGNQKQYKRILLKLSGEELMGNEGFGIDPKVLDRMALEIGQLVGIGVQVGLVIGGGNLFRGAALNAAGMDRVTGDHMGMLATVMNALAMRDALERTNISSQVMSSIPMSGVVEHYDRRRAIRYLKDGDVVIFAAGTGNPFLLLTLRPVCAVSKLMQMWCSKQLRSMESTVQTRCLIQKRSCIQPLPMMKFWTRNWALWI